MKLNKIQLSNATKNQKKITKWIFYSLIIFMLYGLVTEIFNILIPVPGVYFFPILGLTVVVSLILIIMYKIVDLMILIMLIVSFVGFVFKSLHWPGAGVLMTIGWSFPGVLLWIVLFQKIKGYDTRTERFLNFFKNLICVTLMVSYIGLNFKMMHWPGGGILRSIALPLFILSLLSVIFLLPGSNFIEWTREHKRLFYRALLVPLLYMTIITAMAEVFSDTFQGIILNKARSQNIGFYAYPYEIPVKDGMEVIP